MHFNSCKTICNCRYFFYMIVLFKSALMTLSILHFNILGISVLRPTLFNLFFNDITHTLLNYLALYSDDTTAPQTILIFLYRNFQKHFDMLWTGATRKVKSNASKTTFLYFTRTFFYLNRLTLDNTSSRKDNTKYRLVILDKRLTFKKHSFSIGG